MNDFKIVQCSCQKKLKVRSCDVAYKCPNCGFLFQIKVSKLDNNANQNAGQPKKKKFRSNKESNILNKRSKGEKVVYAFVFAFFGLYALSLILPFVSLILNSLKEGMEYIDHAKLKHLFYPPEVPLFKNYLDALTTMKATNSKGEYVYLPIMLLNSIWYTCIFVGAGVFASSLTAYAVAKYQFKGRAVIDGIAIFSMTIPVIGTSAAMLQMLTFVGVYNTPMLPLFIGFGGFGFNYLVLRGFFANLSWSYAESVFVDGGGDVTVFFKIMLPQAVPCLLTLFLMSFITVWNDYQTLLLYMPDYPTLASGLYLVERSLTRDPLGYPMYYAGLVISIIPIIIIFSIFSETIMANFTVGGLKG